MTHFKQGRSMVAGLLVAGLVLSLSACSASTATPTAAPTDAPTAAAATTAPTAAPASAAAKTGTVGIVAFDSTSFMDKNFADNAKSKLEGDGFKVLMQDPKGDTGQANAICSQYVTAKVDAIAVITFAIDQMATCVAGAKAANIPLFFEGSPLIAGMAGAVDVSLPMPINDVFIKYVTDNAITDILTLDYSPGTPCRLRAKYRDEQLAAKAPSVKVTKHEFPIPGQVVDAQNATAAWLAAHPAGTGKLAIWSCFVDPTSGAVAALNQVGRTDVPIFTWDFGKTILPAIQNGQVAADLMIDSVKVGGQVGQMVEDYLNGNTTPQAITAASLVLTKDNIAQFLKDNPGALQ
jgi:ABC-type sugar transport system substrate-binding protein